VIVVIGTELCCYVTCFVILIAVNNINLIFYISSVFCIVHSDGV